jgi:hypothetical protein
VSPMVLSCFQALAGPARMMFFNVRPSVDIASAME